MKKSKASKKSGAVVAINPFDLPDGCSFPKVRLAESTAMQDARRLADALICKK
jgi:hypothetical protein